MITKVSSLFYLRKEEHSKILQKQIWRWFELSRGHISLTVQKISFNIFKKLRQFYDEKNFWVSPQKLS